MGSGNAGEWGPKKPQAWGSEWIRGERRSGVGRRSGLEFKGTRLHLLLKDPDSYCYETKFAELSMAESFLLQVPSQILWAGTMGILPILSAQPLLEVTPSW